MTRRNLVLAALSLLLSGLVLHGTAGASIFPKEKTPDEQRAEIHKTRDQALKDLYRVQPEAERHIRKAAGYAVFGNFGVKVLVAGGGSGTGLVVDNKTKKETFMKMAEVQAGLGFGVKKFRLVWVFENKADLDRFIGSGFTSSPMTAWHWSSPPRAPGITRMPT